MHGIAANILPLFVPLLLIVILHNKVRVNKNKEVSYHEEGAEIHPTEGGIFHLRDFEEYFQQFFVLFQGGEKNGSGGLKEKNLCSVKMHLKNDSFF